MGNGRLHADPRPISRLRSLLSQPSSVLGMKSFVKHFKDQWGSFAKASACHSLLSNNEPLDDEQRLEVGEEIHRLESNYEQLTGRPWALPLGSSVKIPSSKVRDLDAQIRALHCLLSPIRRIPIEVLRKSCSSLQRPRPLAQ